MDSWKQYVFTVILCTCICRILTLMVSDTRQKALVQLICGIFVGTTMLYPFSRLRPEQLLTFSQRDRYSAQRWISQGENLAKETRAESIKASCETYILNKAELLGAALEVEIFLNEDLIPEFAEISTDCSSDVRSKLQDILAADLGILKENQTWIWNQENRGS